MLEDAKYAALGDITTCMSEDVAVGSYSAFMTNDKRSWGIILYSGCLFPTCFKMILHWKNIFWQLL